VTTTEATDVTVDDAFFARYQQAWTDGDIDAIVSMMTPDALYEASFGPEPWGQQFVGRAAIRAGLEAMHAAAGERPSHDYGERYAFGNHGFSTWTSTSVAADGTRSAVHGADFYEFRDGLVAKKIAFRKAKG
jgi:ketosteroid isomerase-like protein